MELLHEIIYQQNKDFLQRIANDMFIDCDDKLSFIQRYHKKNFSFFQQKKHDPIEKYKKKIEKCVKK